MDVKFQLPCVLDHTIGILAKSLEVLTNGFVTMSKQLESEIKARTLAELAKVEAERKQALLQQAATEALSKAEQAQSITDEILNCSRVHTFVLTLFRCATETHDDEIEKASLLYEQKVQSPLYQ